MSKKTFLKTALIQFNASADKAKNIERALGFVARAAGNGAGFILLPEVFVYRGGLKERSVREAVIERIPGPTTKDFL